MSYGKHLLGPFEDLEAQVHGSMTSISKGDSLPDNFRRTLYSMLNSPR